MRVRQFTLLSACIAALLPANLFAADPAPAGPAYQIVLRSRTSQANPTKTKEAQTGGGLISVEQPDPNTILVTMNGAAVAGSEFHGSSAGITFDLDQAFDILPTRRGLRAPRIAMVGQVVGTLQVTDGGKHDRNCGSAEQSTAMACLSVGANSLLSVAVKPTGVGQCSPVFVDNREGPVEIVATPGNYNLKQTFAIAVAQGRNVCNRQYAVADFDRGPQLDGFWSDALKPFRAIPRKDFGFRVVVRVVEDAANDTK